MFGLRSNPAPIHRRSAIRLLTGLFAFVPVAKALTATPVVAGSQDELKAALKARVASGVVLALERETIRIRDKYATRDLTLRFTDQSMVWKGKYNKGRNFRSQAHAIQPGDRVVARGQRTETGFIVEQMFVNHVKMTVIVDEVRVGNGDVAIAYSEGFSSYPEVSSKTKGVVKLKADYLLGTDVYQRVLGERLQLRGSRLEIVGLRVPDGSVIASNVLFEVKA